jgi:DNA-binding PadR family transcriptional regulator
METRGWLRSDWGISEKGRRARYYELTAAGRKALEKEVSRWQRYVRAVAKLGEA